MKIAQIVSIMELRPNSRTPKTATLMHYGVKGMHWGVRRTKEELARISSTKISDTEIHKSVGAKSKNYDIVNKSSGEKFHFVEGTKIQDSEVFAGKGTRTSLHDGVGEKMSERYGGKPENWQHCKGKGIIDYYGEERKAEVHWFQEESAGKHEFKVKKWLD
jgi:hypothetical protein